MHYATLTDIARVAPGSWGELAQLLGCSPAVTAGLFEAVATGGDLDAWSAEAVAEATGAVARLTDALERTSRHADTFIVPRYGQRLTPDIVAGSDLPSVVATITLLRLFGYRATKDMRDACAWAERYLVDLSQGRASLGTPEVEDNDPETVWAFSPRALPDDVAEGYR